MNNGPTQEYVEQLSPLGGQKPAVELAKKENPTCSKSNSDCQQNKNPTGQGCGCLSPSKPQASDDCYDENPLPPLKPDVNPLGDRKPLKRKPKQLRIMS